MPARMPEPGDRAPSFTGKDQKGNNVGLKDFAGKKLALYFYPKDDTPGCTKQACNLRDHESVLQKAGVEVVGVSPDDSSSHARFSEKYGLGFPLIADPKRVIIERYGVWGEKNMYGRKSMGLKRTTFLIDEDGRIVDVIKRPKTADHAAEVLRRFGR